MRPYFLIAVLVLLACAYLALGACATGKAVACPPMKEYTAAEEHDLAQALGQLDPNGPVAKAMIDYARLRAADRACLAGH